MASCRCRTSPSCAERRGGLEPRTAPGRILRSGAGSKARMISIAGVVLLLGFLLGLVALVAAPIVLALLIVGVVLRLVFFVLFLPFRLLRGFVVLAGIGILLILGALPLLPFLLIGAGIYLVFRGMRSR